MYRHPFLVSTGFVATLVAAVSLAVAFWNTGYDTQVHFHTEEALLNASSSELP
jgi:hypothetical protein